MNIARDTVGHPVNVASGDVYATYVDAVILGRIDLLWNRVHNITWERRYQTASLDGPAGPLGPGWTARYLAELREESDHVRFLSPEGYVERFLDPDHRLARGGIVRNLGTSQEIQKEGPRYVVTRWTPFSRDVERYVFEHLRGAEWILASVEDVTGQGLDILRDGNGRLSGVRQRLEKRTLAVSYDPSGRIEHISVLLPSDRAQVLTRYEYDSQGRLAVVNDALGQADRYEYDSRHRIVREIAKDGGVFSFSYDDRGRCVRTSGLDGYDEKRLRYRDFGWTEVDDSLGNTTRFQWLPSRQVIREIGPLGATTQTEYDEHGRIRATTQPNGGQTEYGYDDQGNLNRMKDPLGNEWRWTFNRSHLVLSLQDPAERTWRREYDANNRLVVVTEPPSSEWRLRYDELGNLVAATDPTGVSVHQRFDVNGALLEGSDWGGLVLGYREDELGRIVERRDPAGSFVRFSYNLLGRMTGIDTASGRVLSRTYDAGGNITSLADFQGNETRYRYGPCQRLLEVVDPLGRVVRYRWGSEPDRLEEIVNAKGERHTWRYDAADRIVEETGFDGRTLTFEFNRAGDCIAVTNGVLDRISYAFDLRGRVIRETYPDGATAEFTYDAFGNMLSAVNSASEVRFQRDALGRVIRESQNDEVIETAYDAADRLTRIATTRGLDVAYRYQGGRLAAVSVNHGEPMRIEYDAVTRSEVISFTAGARLERRFDEMGWPLEERMGVAGGRQPVRRRYRYDGASRIVALEDSLWRGETYSYDASEHVTGVVSERGETETFAYDEAGNLRMRRDGVGAEVPLEYESGNRLVRRGDTRYSYDAHGRLIKKGERGVGGGGPTEWTYSWNAAGRLSAVTTPNGDHWQYSYDALGRRVAKRGPGSHTRFVWTGNVVAHEIEGGVAHTGWIFDPRGFTPLGKVDRGALYYVLSNQRGTPYALVDRNGSIAWAARLGAWGSVKEELVGATGCPIRFQGHWLDAETGLHYSRYRYYDPETGRFISTDPVGVSGGLNLYEYAPNPLNYVDPLGLGRIGDWFKNLVLAAGAVMALSGHPDSAAVKMASKQTSAEEQRRKRQEESEREQARQGSRKKAAGGPPGDDDEDEKKPC